MGKFGSLDKAVELYRNAQSYFDSGVVTTTSIGNVEQIAFRTSFDRNKMFRFEWNTTFIWPGEGDSSSNAIWATENGAYVQFSGEQPQQVDGLAIAIAEATGVSLGSAFNAASMLMPDSPNITAPSILQSCQDKLCREEEDFFLTGFYRLVAGDAEKQINLYLDHRDFHVTRIFSTAQRILRLEHHEVEGLPDSVHDQLVQLQEKHATALDEPITIWTDCIYQEVKIK